MGYQKERDEFLSIMGQEGIRPDVARSLLREATTLQRLAELECSSEAADRDQVRCPAGRITAKKSAPCLCKDYGSFDEAKAEPLLDPALGAEVRARLRATAARRAHGTIPRHMVKSAASEARVRKVCTAHNLTPHFGGDPRGCVLLVGVPSGRTNDWGQRGIAVPAQGYTAAQMDRISR
jgi:hypothetical protein